MSVKIKYFGLLTEITGKHEEVLTSNAENVSELLEDLFELYPELSTKDFKIAVGHDIANLESRINTEEVALLPPFSGG